LTRSPLGRCNLDGAATRHSIPEARRNRASPNPVGPAHRSPELGPATIGPTPRYLPDPGSTCADGPHRSTRRSRTRRQIVRAHPARHSYAHSSLRPPATVALPEGASLPGNPRPIASEASALHPYRLAAVEGHSLARGALSRHRPADS
jgi:hypothetical protein